MLKLILILHEAAYSIAHYSGVKFSPVSVSAVSFTFIRIPVFVFLMQLPTVLLKAQYVDVTVEQGIYYYGNIQRDTGVSTYDFNHDGLDDITFGSADEGVFVFQNTGDGFVQVYLFDFIPGFIISVFWVDIDNDFDEDFFAVRDGMNPVLLRHDEGDVFTDISPAIQIPTPGAVMNCAAWADYDNDGYLDLYLPTFQFPADNITNWLFHNNGDATFTECSLQAGVSNDARPTWQPTWIDFDQDGDQDLFVPNERDYGCSLYRNNNDGSFTDIADEAGVNILEDPMGVAWSDFDHDDDYDFYVTNTTEGNQFMMNNGGVFTDVADSLSVATSGYYSWGVQFIDVQNDSFEDLFFTTAYTENISYDYLFLQDSLHQFPDEISEDFPSGSTQGYAAAELDADNNGFADIVIKTVLPIGAILLQNETEDSQNHWLKVGLQGTVSNANAVGSTVKIFVDDNVFTQIWQCGEGFASQNSQYEIFGLGDAEYIDSLMVIWPGGWTDVFYNLVTNQYYAFVEGETMSSSYVIQQTYLCPGDTILLMCSAGIDAVWSNDEEGTAIEVCEPGAFIAGYTDEYGFEHTEMFEVYEVEPPSYSVNIVGPSCAGYHDASVHIQPEGNSTWLIEWPNDVVSPSLNLIGAGEYDFIITDQNGCVFQNSVVVSDPQPLLAMITTDSICPGNFTEVNYDIAGGSGSYQLDWNGLNPEAVAAGTHLLEITDSFGCVVSAEFTVDEFPSFTPVVVAPVACYGETVAISYDVDGPAAGYVFDFDDADPESLLAGDYTVVVYDDHFCMVEHDFVVTEAPELTADFIFDGSAVTDSVLLTIDVSGGTPPYTFMWSDGSGDVAVMASFGQGYSCLISDALGCSQLFSVNVTDTRAIDDKSSSLVFPNPCNDLLNVANTAADFGTLVDISGRVVKQWSFSGENTQLEMADVSTGAYYLRVGDEVHRIIKADQ